MTSARTRDSLSARIEDTQRRTEMLMVRRPTSGRPRPSFSERYRGTEFETPVTGVTRGEEGVARGRLAVWMVAAAGLGFCALIVASASA